MGKGHSIAENYGTLGIGEALKNQSVLEPNPLLEALLSVWMLLSWFGTLMCETASLLLDTMGIREAFKKV